MFYSAGGVADAALAEQSFRRAIMKGVETYFASVEPGTRMEVPFGLCEGCDPSLVACMASLYVLQQLLTVEQVSRGAQCL
jgi:hypothetical protein